MISFTWTYCTKSYVKMYTLLWRRIYGPHVCFSWCGTHTKIRNKLVVIVTAVSQKITLWGPQRTPLGILRVKEMSLVCAIDVVVVVKQCSQLLNRVQMLYKIQRVYSFHCWCNRNAVDFTKKHRTLSELQPEGVKKSTRVKRVKAKLSLCTPWWWHMAMRKWRCNFTQPVNGNEWSASPPPSPAVFALWKVFPRYPLCWTAWSSERNLLFCGELSP